MVFSQRRDYFETQQQTDEIKTTVRLASKPSLYHWLTLLLPAGSSGRRQDGDISIAGRGCGYGGGGAVTSSAGSSTYILNLGLAFCRFSTCLDCGYYIHLDYYYMVAVKLPQTYHGFQSAVAALS